jgi:hypothetical protein
VATDVPCRGELNQTTVAPLVAALVSERNSPSDPVVLDLRDLEFAHPFPLAVLAAQLEAQVPPDGAVAIRCPLQAGARQYLASCGFLQEAAQHVEVVGDDGLRHRSKSWAANTVLPLTRLRAGEDIAPVLERVDDRLDVLLRGDRGRADSVRAPIRSTIREMCVNIFHHADYDTGWIAAQQYRNRRTGVPYVEIGVADAGRGIRTSLATEYPQVAEVPDAEAVGQALRGKSRRGAAYLGGGFFVLQRAAKELDGRFYLRSGHGAALRPRRGGLRTIEADERWPGTHLRIALTCQ